MWKTGIALKALLWLAFRANAPSPRPGRSEKSLWIYLFFSQPLISNLTSVRKHNFHTQKISQPYIFIRKLITLLIPKCNSYITKFCIFRINLIPSYPINFNFVSIPWTRLWRIRWLQINKKEAKLNDKCINKESEKARRTKGTNKSTKNWSKLIESIDIKVG